MNSWTMLTNTSSRRVGIAGGCLLLLFASLSTWAETTVKVATIAPEGSPLMVELRNAAKEIDKQTEARVKFKFYSGGVMGDDAAVKRKMRAGQLNGAVLQTSVLTGDVPDLNVYNLPLQFKNIEEVTKVRADLDSYLMEDLEEAGYISFGFVGIGLAYAMGSKKATTLQEARRLKIWAPKNDQSSTLMLQAFGITPIPLTIVDVLTGLQTGLIDTVASPPVAAVTLQWHTQIKYLMDVPFVYVYSVYVLDQSAFKDVEEDDQEVVRTLMGQAMEKAEERGIADHSAAMDVMDELGVELIKPDPDSLKAWQTLADIAAANWVRSDLLSKEMFDRLNASLAEARKENAE